MLQLYLQECLYVLVYGRGGLWYFYTQVIRNTFISSCIQRSLNRRVHNCSMRYTWAMFVALLKFVYLCFAVFVSYVLVGYFEILLLDDNL